MPQINDPRYLNQWALNKIRTRDAWEQLAQKIDAEAVERYERLFASKGDAAVVAVEHGVCTGCHMKVTTATVVRARSGSEIVSCEQCGRILYIAE